jgi:hypothetical protein
MAIELGVLRREDGLPEQRADVVVADNHAPLCRELTDDLVVGRVDPRDRAGRVVVQRRDLRQIAGIGEEHPAEDAEDPRHDEQRNDDGIAGDADDVWAMAGSCTEVRGK